MGDSDEFNGDRWHDNAIHGFAIVEGEDGCSGDLILDIDFILEWLHPDSNNQSFRFRMAPSDLIFHGVTDLHVCVDYAASRTALQAMMIDRIDREAMTYPNGYASFAWKIALNRPGNGFLAFRADSFTQLQRKAPRIAGAQYLTPAERAAE